MKCPNCGGTDIFQDEGYETVWRCWGCGRVGTIKDFEEGN